MWFSGLTSSLLRCHLKTTNKWQNMKTRNCFCLLFRICEWIFIETHSLERRCYRSGTYTVCRLVRASFSPEIVQVGAVKWLTQHVRVLPRGWTSNQLTPSQPKPLGCWLNSFKHQTRREIQPSKIGHFIQLCISWACSFTWHQSCNNQATP